MHFSKVVVWFVRVSVLGLGWIDWHKRFHLLQDIVWWCTVKRLSIVVRLSLCIIIAFKSTANKRCNWYSLCARH